MAVDSMVRFWFCLDASLIEDLCRQLSRRRREGDFFHNAASEVLKGLIAFDFRLRAYINMKRRFLHLLLGCVIHQSNQKISAQSILLSLNHTHPIQCEMPLHLVINIPRSILPILRFCGFLMLFQYQILTLEVKSLSLNNPVHECLFEHTIKFG